MADFLNLSVLVGLIYSIEICETILHQILRIRDNFIFLRREETQGFQREREELGKG